MKSVKELIFGEFIKGVYSVSVDQTLLYSTIRFWAKLHRADIKEAITNRILK